MIPSDGLTPGIGEGLEGMTHFVLFWSEACRNSDWVVNTELPAALRRQAAGTPLLIVRTDGTLLPPDIADVLRIEADGMTPTEIAAALASAIERLERRHRIGDIAGAGLVSSSLQHPPRSEQRRSDS
jgi:hypothetical protein